MLMETNLESEGKASEHPSRSKILDAAELIFAEQGYSRASTRAVATLAGVNLGMLHYFFGSKRELFRAAYQRRAAPVVEARFNLLKAAQKAQHGKPLSLETLVTTFVAPFFQSRENPGNAAFLAMHSRLHTEPEEVSADLFKEMFDESTQEFVKCFSEALPDLPADVIYWRVYFMSGAYTSLLLQTGRLRTLSEGLCDIFDVNTSLAQFVPFIVAGFKAPAPALP
ncbi:TetR/AcrR family transcriptional regulator [Paraburkholderia sp. RL17-347-BIC-D]|uniref:TetR/AcrR family transcriptional regulator n=1 Tax=Paraburkholderia sp. RL17-347-BIC-D TaxID=3031632 RepID=UPI0038BD1ABC